MANEERKPNYIRYRLGLDEDLESNSQKIITEFPPPLRRLLIVSKELLNESKKEKVLGRTMPGSFLRFNETANVYYGISSEHKPREDEARSASSLAKTLRLNKFLKNDNHWVKWCLKIDENKIGLDAATLNIVFKYLPKLNIVVAKSKIDLTTTDQHPSLLSDLLLRGESVLNFLNKEDSGFENPNSTSQYLLVHAGLRDFSELAPSIGYPYNWVQDLCNMKFGLHDTVSTAAKKSEDILPADPQVLRLIVKSILDRFRSLLESWHEIRATELRILTPSSFCFKPWNYVDVKVLQRLFRIRDTPVADELTRAKGRLATATYVTVDFEIRVAAIFKRRFPIELPQMKLEIVDRRHSAQNFIDHSTKATMEMSLNICPFVTEEETHVLQRLQLIELMYFLDELLAPQTLNEIGPPLNKSRRKLSKNTDIDFGSQSQTTQTQASNSSSSNTTNKRKIWEPFSPGIQTSKKAHIMFPRFLPRSLLPGFESTGKRSHPSDSKKSVDTFQFQDESAIMDTFDDINQPQSPSKSAAPNKLINTGTELFEQAPLVQNEIESVTPNEKEFKFTEPLGKLIMDLGMSDLDEIVVESSRKN